MQEKIMLVDLSNILYRSHFAHSTLCTEQGVSTGALFGLLEFVRMMRKRLPEWRPVFIGDGAPTEKSGRGWRFQLWKGYKAARAANSKLTNPRAAVMDQQPYAARLLRWAGYAVHYIPGLEADDLIGISARLLFNRGNEISITSGDQDFYQLLGIRLPAFRPSVSFILEPGKWRRIDRNAVLAKFEIMPEKWTRYRALSGDASDGMPGLRGCGPRTAVALLRCGVDPAQPWELQPKKPLKKWAPDEWERVQLFFRLSRIVTNPKNPELTKEVRQALEGISYNPPPIKPTLFSNTCSLLALNKALSSRRGLFWFAG